MDKFEKIIFKLYIYFLPVTAIDIFNGKLYSISNSFSFIFHIMGIMMLIIRYRNIKIRNNRILNYTTIFIITLNILSLIMAIYLHDDLGTLLGRDTYKAIIPHLIYYFQILFAFYYNYLMFKKFESHEIQKWIFNSIKIFIFISYIQIFLLLINNTNLTAIYQNIEKILGIEANFPFNNRVRALNKEPADMGGLLSIYILPFVLSNILKYPKNKKYLLVLILLCPIVFYSKSTATYIGFMIVLLYFSYMYCKNSSSNLLRVLKLMYSSILIMIILYFIHINGIINFSTTSNLNVNSTEQFYGFKYLLFEKFTDSSNSSTIHRNSSLYTNIEAFKNYPLLGVGNGNQGFFYIRYFPEWAFSSYESVNTYLGKNGWPGSGTFLPTYISSYGGIGLLLLMIYVVMIKQNMIKLQKKNIIFYNMYKLGIIAFIPLSIISTNIIGIYYIIFVFSLILID